MTTLSNAIGMLESPVPRPAQSYGEALARARAFQALDDDSVAPFGYTKLLEHGERTPYCVVLFHGLTNNPAQYAELAPMLFELGANVFVPRMPDHGCKDRLTKCIAELTAERVLASTSEAIDIACGLGERVAVMGISMGGLLAAYFGQCRSDVYTAVPVAPDFALLQLPYEASKLLARIVRWIPNIFLWWDPRVRDEQRPKTAYPRFATHALMQTLRIGDHTYAAARSEPAKATRIVTVVNRADPAVNNEVTHEVVMEWRGRRADGIEYVELRGLPENHDIIEPDNPLARTGIVYPELIKVLGIDTH